MNVQTEVTFVDDHAAKAYDCGICLEKLRNPVAVCTDHVFCKECITGLVRQQGPIFKCPNCRKLCNLCYVKRNRFIDRRMAELLTKCPNHQITPQKALYLQSLHTSPSSSDIKDTVKPQRLSYNRSRSRSRSRSRERSSNTKTDLVDNDNDNDNTAMGASILCPWTGPWSGIQSHITNCPLQIIHCKYCNQLMMNKDKPTHYLLCGNYPVRCELCLCMVHRSAMSSHIEHICDKKIVECSYCNAQMARIQIRHHRFTECPELIISCPYLKHGCMVNMKRKNLQPHLTNETAMHLQLVDLAYENLMKRVENLEDKIYH